MMKNDFILRLEESVMPTHDDVEIKCYPIPAKEGLTSLFAGLECRKCAMVLKPSNSGSIVVFECPDCGYEMADFDRTRLCQEYIEAIAKLGGIDLNQNKKKVGLIWRCLMWLGVKKKSQGLLLT
jgi:predicted RNA-binding Zn-ribbon protein involved in translation (DUF1610 family)